MTVTVTRLLNYLFPVTSYIHRPHYCYYLFSWPLSSINLSYCFCFLDLVYRSTSLYIFFDLLSVDLAVMINFLDLVHRSTSKFLDLVHRSTTLLSVFGVVGFRQKTVNFVLVQMLTGLRKSETQWQRRWVQSASVVYAASACSVSNVARPHSIAVKKEKSRTGVGEIPWRRIACQ